MSGRVTAAICALVVAVGCESTQKAESDQGLSEESPLRLATELPIESSRVGARSMVYDGKHFAIAWAALPGTSADFQLMFARVSAEGVVVEGPKKVTTFDLHPASLRLFATPGGYRVWFRERGSEVPVWGLRLDADASALGTPDELESIRNTYCSTSLAVAFTGESFGLFFDQYDSAESLYRLHFRRFTVDLVPLGDASVVTTSTANQGCPTLTWLATDEADGGRFLGLWREGDRARRVVLDGAGAVVHEAALVFDSGEEQRYAWSTPDGAGGALVAWRGTDSTKCPLLLRVDPAEAMWPAPARLLPDDRSESVDLTLGVLGSRALISWQSNAKTPVPVIKVGWFDVGLDVPTLRDTETISDALYYFSGPTAVVGASEIGLLFEGAVEGSDRLYFRVFRP